MILNKIQLLEYLRDGKLAFNPPLDAYQLQPDSIDLRLGTTFYIPETWRMAKEGRVGVRADYVEIKEHPEYFKMIKLIPGQYFEMLPHEFVIISTLEKIEMKEGTYAATLYPRTSVLRRGLLIEGGVVDVLYQGYLTIPIFNSTNRTVHLYPGERVCHLMFETISSEMTLEDAQQHGLNTAKYHGSTQYGLDVKLDKEEEIEFIRAGKLQELKSAHPILTATAPRV